MADGLTTREGPQIPAEPSVCVSAQRYQYQIFKFHACLQGTCAFDQIVKGALQVDTICQPMMQGEVLQL